MSMFGARTFHVGAAFAKSFWRTTCGIRHYHPPSPNQVTTTGSKGFNKYGDEIPITEDVSQVSALPEMVSEPSFQSLGLGGYHPSGLIQQAFEFLHVTADLPWWGALATGTIVIRLCLLPIVVKNRIELSKIVKANFESAKLLSSLLKAQKEGKSDVVLKLVDRQHKVYDSVSFTRLLGLTLAQGSVFLSMAFAIRGMARHQVESLMTGGLAWFPDLTVADPLYLLPLFCASSVMAIMLVGRNPNAPLPPFVMKFFFVLSPVIFLLLCKYEAALTFYFAINSAVTILQAAALNQPKIQERLNLTWPQIPQTKIDKEELFQLQKAVEELREREMLKKMEKEREGRERSRQDDENEEEKRRKE